METRVCRGDDERRPCGRPPDNDAPVEPRQQVATRFSVSRSSVKVLALAGLTGKGDVSDWSMAVFGWWNIKSSSRSSRGHSGASIPHCRARHLKKACLTTRRQHTDDALSRAGIHFEKTHGPEMNGRC